MLARFEDRIVFVRQGNLMATAFHPELTGDYRLHKYFVDLVTRNLNLHKKKNLVKVLKIGVTIQ